MTLPAFAAECRRLCAEADSYLLQSPALSHCQSIGQTDTGPLHRLCSAYHVDRIKKQQADLQNISGFIIDYVKFIVKVNLG